MQDYGDRPRPGRQPRVDAVTSARLKERIVAGAALERDGVVAFRGVDGNEGGHRGEPMTRFRHLALVAASNLHSPADVVILSAPPQILAYEGPTGQPCRTRRMKR